MNGFETEAPTAAAWPATSTGGIIAPESFCLSILFSASRCSKSSRSWYWGLGTKRLRTTFPKDIRTLFYYPFLCQFHRRIYQPEYIRFFILIEKCSQSQVLNVWKYYSYSSIDACIQAIRLIYIRLLLYFIFRCVRPGGLPHRFHFCFFCW